MIVSLSEEEIKNAVRERYSRLAVLNQTCCGKDTENVCCGSTTTEEADLPNEALSVIASCGSPLAHVQVGEVLRGLVELIQSDAQTNLVIIDRHRFRHHQWQSDFGDFGGAGIEADEIDGVLWKTLSNQSLHRHRHFFGGEESAVTHHAAGHVEQDNGGATRDAFMKVQFEIVFVKMNRGRWPVATGQ